MCAVKNSFHAMSFTTIDGLFVAEIFPSPVMHYLPVGVCCNLVFSVFVQSSVYFQSALKNGYIWMRGLFNIVSDDFQNETASSSNTYIPLPTPYFNKTSYQLVRCHTPAWHFI